VKTARPIASPRKTRTRLIMKSAPDLAEQIRRRAYELYEQRGRDEGHELGDWLRAQSELTQRKTKAVGA
jgi:hypothetical protein